MARTEEDKIVQAGIKVILGGEEHSIKPLVIRESREWRAKVIKLIAPIPKYVETTTDTLEDFEQVLTAMLVTMPDQVVDLFFDYAKDLDREEIEGKATDKELADAFKEVIAVAFPLAESLPKVITRIFPKEKDSQSEESLNS